MWRAGSVRRPGRWHITVLALESRCRGPSASDLAAGLGRRTTGSEGESEGCGKGDWNIVSSHGLVVLGREGGEAARGACFSTPSPVVDAISFCHFRSILLMSGVLVHITPFLLCLGSVASV